MNNDQMGRPDDEPTSSGVEPENRIAETANPPYPGLTRGEVAADPNGPEPENSGSDPADDSVDLAAVSTDGSVPRKRGMVVPALLTVILLLGAALIYTQVAEPDGGAVADVARETASHLTNFDYRTIEKDTDEIKKNATGAFAEQFELALGGSTTVFVKAIKEAKGTSKGKVHYVTTSVDGDNANAVVYLTQTITNSRVTEPSSEDRYMSMKLIKTASGWKVSDVQLLLQGNPAVQPAPADSQPK